MIRITVDFDDHHYGSARELRVILTRDWAARLVTVTDEGGFDLYKPEHVKSGCEFCKEVENAEVGRRKESGTT